MRAGCSGAKSKNTFKPNPSPYNVKPDLADLSADNTLNLHYQENRCNTIPKVNEEVLPLYRLARYYFVGTSDSCQSTSLKTEISIARYFVGVHKELLNNEDYKQIGECEWRRKLWRQWMNGDKEGDEYAKKTYQ